MVIARKYKVEQGLILIQLKGSSATICNWYSYFRETVVYDLENSNFEKMCGSNIIVEIDESKFEKRKYNRGHRIEGIWVVDGEIYVCSNFRK